MPPADRGSRSRARRVYTPGWIIRGELLNSQAVGAREAGSFSRLLHERAAREPERVPLTFVSPGGVEIPLDYAAIDAGAQAIAARLRALGLTPGDRALLVHRTGPEMVFAFFGCLYAGVIAVPVYPTFARGRAIGVLRNLFAAAQPKVVLTEPLLESALAAIIGEDGPPIDTGARNTPGEARPPIDGPIAFLQYTSGSTRTPRGVMVTHQNLIFNSELIRRAFGTGRSSRVVSWLPLYHDMGLIGGLLQPIYCDGRAWLMAPEDFLEEPRRWLELISRTGADVSGGPDFAYALCARKIAPEARAGLELRAWRLAFDGAEPVRAGTLARFAEAFREVGFSRSAFFPCYGLAEATLFVAGAHHTGETAIDYPCPEDQEAAIVDPLRGARCAPGEVGEIWIRGPSVTAGYWEERGARSEVFDAELDGRGGWLRSGDLGHATANGALSIGGRLRDLIILRGRNVFPQDLEATAELAHPALRPGCGAAFGVEVEGETRACIAHELRRGVEAEGEIAAAIRRAIAEVHQVEVYRVALLSPGAIPKTSSGKIKRHAAAEVEPLLAVVFGAADAGAGDARARVARDAGAEDAGAEDARVASAGDARARVAGDASARVAAICARAIGVPVEAIGAGMRVAELGVDSLRMIELRNAIDTELGVRVALSDLWTRPIGELAQNSTGGSIDAAAGSVGAPAEDPAAEDALSEGQLGLWVLQRATPSSTTYQITRAFRVEDEARFDRARLDRAIEAMLDRHPLLTFAYPLDLDPPRAIRAATRPAIEEVRGSLEALAAEPIDLARGVLRIRLLRDATGSILIFTVHHLAVDLASLASVFDPAAHPEPARATYADFVRRERAMLRSPEGDRLAVYWTAQLRDPPAPLDLADRKISAGPPGAHRFRLDAERTRRLSEQAREAGATIAGAVFTAFATLLYRSTGQCDFLISTIASGRTQRAFEHVTGYFARPLPIRVKTSPRESFVASMAQNERAIWEALDHQDYPFRRIAELLPERALEVVFAFQRAPSSNETLAPLLLPGGGGRWTFGDLALTGIALPPEAPIADLVLSAVELDGGVELVFEHTARFDRETIEAMAAHLLNLIESAGREPRSPIGALAMDTEEERAVLTRFESTEHNFDPQPTLIDLFEARAREAPHAPCIFEPERTWSYQEIDRAAERVAQALIDAGVRIEDRVAIVLPPSADFVIAALASFKAGAAYVPIDPRDPPLRQRAMIDDAAARVVIDHPPKIDPAPARPRRSTSGENLAYVIYTSGSTGRPKGVACTHASVLNLLADFHRRRALRPGSTSSWWTRASFDVSVYEVFGPLIAGAALRVVPELLREDPPRLIAWLAEHHIAGAYLPGFALPALRDVLREGGEKAPPLERLLVGVEPIAASVLESIAAARPALTLINGYGPTETTVCAALYDVPATHAGLDTPAPVGRPTDNNRIYALDGALQRVPLGRTGALYISGRPLARGYFGSPRHTAERFIPDPFSSIPGARMYESGDLGRIDRRGRLSIRGRADAQLKFRGLRIEPGEISAALLACSGAEEAFVRVEARRLLAWIGGAAIEEDALRKALRDFLPAGMIPSRIAVLDRLPRTPAGKVDHRALPVPAEREQAIAPRTPIEETLSAIFAEVLGAETVGVEEDFFALGGHSLEMTRVAMRVAETFGVRLPFEVLLRAPTVAELAAELQHARKAASAPIPATSKTNPEASAPLSPAQRRLWFLHRLEGGSDLYNMLGLILIEGSVDEQALARAFDVLVARHESLRTTFSADREQPEQRVAPERAGVLETIAVESLERAKALAAAEGRRSFDLQRGPLFVAKLYTWSKGQYLLSLALHHIIADGWSFRILARELAALYSAFKHGRSASLPPLPIQYRDYARWQLDHLDGARRTALTDYWKRALTPRRERRPLVLPADRASTDHASTRARGGRHRFTIDRALTARVKQFSASAQVTPFMTLLSAFEALLHLYSKEEEIFLGVPVAGRERGELEPLIGFFSNIVVLRVDFREAPSFRALVAQVRHALLEAFEHQELPLDEVVAAVSPKRTASTAPLFQVVFHSGPILVEPELEGVATKVVELEQEVAKFELDVAIEERDGGMLGEVLYRADLFSDAGGARIAQHLCAAISALIGDPDASSVETVRRATGWPSTSAAVLAHENDSFRF